MTALKVLYHLRLFGLYIQQNPDSFQVGKQGHVVKLWGIREEIGQANRGTKRGENEEEPAALGVVTGTIHHYVRNREAETPVGANRGWGVGSRAMR